MIHCAITTHAEGVPAAAYATVDGVCLPRCQMHIARARRDGCTVRLRPLTPEPATVTVTRAPVRPLPEPEPVMTDASKPLRSTPLNRSGATPNRHLPLILRPDADAHPELCRVADCTGKVKASGCCDTHGITIRRDGDPTAILKRADRSEAARRAAATRARVKGEAMATAPVVEQPGPAVPVEDGDGIVLARTDDPVTSVGENYTTPEAAAAHLGARLPDSVTESGVWVWVDFPAPAPTREQELQAQVEEQAGQIRRLEARIKGADATNDAMARSLSDIDSILDTTGAAPGQTTTERVRALASRTAPLGAALAEVDRLTTQAALDAAALTTPEVYVGVVSAAVEEEIGRLRRQRDEALADLAALRLEHEAHKILLTCARRDRDEARGANIQAVKDNVSPSASVDVLDETVAGLKAQRDEARRECGDARDETTRLWDATEADRVRTAELESRPTYEDGVRAALYAVSPRRRSLPDAAPAVDRAEAAILALLEPKP